jgi:hypothetical protein
MNLLVTDCESRIAHVVMTTPMRTTIDRHGVAFCESRILNDAFADEKKGERWRACGVM